MGILHEKRRIFDFLWRVTTKPYMVETCKSMEKMLRNMKNAIEKTKLQ